jgi:hypothetical protein
MGQSHQSHGGWGVGVKNLYHMFVYLFSGILRTYPIQLEHMWELGLVPNGATMDFSGGERYVVPFAFSQSLMDSEFVDFCTTRMRGDGADAGEWRMTASYSHFGPLGPTFRGRDRMTHTSTLMSIGQVLRMISFEGGSCRSPPDSFVTIKSEIDTLVEMASQCRQNRPMTVLPPIVYFDIVSQ